MDRARLGVERAQKRLEKAVAKQNRPKLQRVAMTGEQRMLFEQFLEQQQQQLPNPAPGHQSFYGPVVQARFPLSFQQQYQVEQQQHQQ